MWAGDVAWAGPGKQHEITQKPEWGRFLGLNYAMPWGSGMTVEWNCLQKTQGHWVKHRTLWTWRTWHLWVRRGLVWSDQCETKAVLVPALWAGLEKGEGRMLQRNKVAALGWVRGCIFRQGLGMIMLTLKARRRANAHTLVEKPLHFWQRFWMS